MPIKHSFCRNCGAHCGVTFEVQENRVVDHRPDPEHPVTRGFYCIKGQLAVDFLNGDEARLFACQKRMPSGAFEPIAAGDAILEIAAKLREVIDQHGPEALAAFYGTSSVSKALTIPFIRYFMRALGSPYLFSTMTIDSSAHWVCDGRMGSFRTGRPYMDDVDLLLIAGSNPMVSHMAFNASIPQRHQVQHLRSLRDRGGRLIVIDPRQTETAKRADIHLQPKPGLDAEIFAGLIHLLLERNGQDAAFTERYLRHVDELREAVRPFTPERVAARTGVTTDALVSIVEALQAARRPTVSCGTGVSMSPHSSTAVHLVHALNALLGGFARAGDRLRTPGFFARKATEEGVRPPHRQWESGPKLTSGHGRMNGEFPTSRLADELGPGGKFRALIITGANPMMSFGEPERLKAALKRLDLLVVVDPRMTETSSLADYIITTPMQYESADFARSQDTEFPEPFVQYTAPVLQPPKGAVEDWVFFNRLANALGLTLVARSQSPDVPDLVLTQDREWSSDDVISWWFQQAGLSLEEVKRHPRGMIVPMDPIVITTPHADDGARLDLCPPDVAGELAAIAAAGEGPSDLPYRLVNRRMVETMNSAFRHNPVTRRRHGGGNSLHMSPDDAAREGVDDTALVAVESAHGVTRARVKIDKTMRPGVLSMTHCWGAPELDEDPLALTGSHAGRLVSMRVTDTQPIDGMPVQSSLPVRLTRVVEG